MDFKKMDRQFIPGTSIECCRQCQEGGGITEDGFCVACANLVCKKCRLNTVLARTDGLCEHCAKQETRKSEKEKNMCSQCGRMLITNHMGICSDCEQGITQSRWEAGLRECSACHKFCQKHHLDMDCVCERCRAKLATADHPVQSRRARLADKVFDHILRYPLAGTPDEVADNVYALADAMIARGCECGKGDANGRK